MFTSFTTTIFANILNLQKRTLLVMPDDNKALQELWYMECVRKWTGSESQQEAMQKLEEIFKGAKDGHETRKS